MDTIILPPSLYDVFLDAVKFDSPDEVLQKVTYHISLPPRDSKRAKTVLSHLLSSIVRLRKYNILEVLIETLREHGVPVEGITVKEAAALPLPLATLYLDTLFSLGWDVNKAISNVQPPVLSYALHDISLVHWLLQKGADPNASCDIDDTPLSFAMTRAPIAIIQVLLQHAQHSHNGHLVFSASQRTDVNEATTIIRLLHQYSKPIDEVLYQDPKSYRLRAPFVLGTPLYYACKDGNLPVALTLIELGADPDKGCMRWDQIVGPSPREVASQRGWTFPGSSRSRESSL